MFNKMIASMLPYFPEKLVWIFSKRYVSGFTKEEAAVACKEYNKNGMKFTLDILGEFIKTIEEAEKNKQEYLELIDYAESQKMDGNYSVKPSMFGLLLDKELCYHHIRDIVAKAASYNNFIRVDMEDSQCTDLEIDMFRKLKTEFPKNVGLVVQAYMRRTSSDLEKMMDLQTPEIPMNYRYCKGIYREPEKIAYKGYDEIREHYLKDIEFLFKNKVYVGIATHDEFLVNGSYKLIEKYQVPRNMYEFQMLYGVTPELRKSIVDKGHVMRIYVPYGKKWFAYSTRRLKENPKMAGMIIKALFVRG